MSPLRAEFESLHRFSRAQRTSIGRIHGCVNVDYFLKARIGAVALSVINSSSIAFAATSY